METSIRRLREYFHTGATVEYEYRMSKLKALKRSIIQHEGEIIQALSEDLGKGAYESYLTEIGIVLSEISLFEKNLKKWMKPKRVRQALATFPSKNRIHSDPYGVCLILSPWNYPFHLAMMPLIGAIAAGNVCVLRTSTKSAATSRVIGEIIRDCFTEHETVHISGEYSHEETLAPRYDHIFFTGSPAVGKLIQKAASRHLTPVVLELGGKSPVIVDKSAAIAVAAMRIAFGKMMNAGQTCTAPDYVYVEASVEQKLVEALKREFTTLTQDALQNDDLPKIIDQKAFDRLIGYIDRHDDKWGGEYNPSTRIIQPALLLNAKETDPSMQSEIFGPILPILRFDDFEELLTRLCANEKPLALYFFSSDPTHIARIQNTVSFGGGCINDTIMHITHHRLPFGGVGNSGIGHYHGKHSFQTFSHQKSMLTSPTWLNVPIRYRPYVEWKEKLMRRILK